MRVHSFILFLGLTSLFATPIAAQIWHPLPHAFQADRYDYVLGSETVPNHPLRADSMSVMGTDTMWYMRPYPALCDTCKDAAFDCTSRFYPGIPLFLGSTLRNLGGGKFHAAHPSDTLILQTKRPLGTTWVFNEIGSIASIDSVYETLLWGSVSDSVKRITVGGTDTILLSKNHGLTRFPSAFGVGDSAPYILSGIAGRNVGRFVPDWKGMFDIEVGTELQYDIRYGGLNNDWQSIFIAEVISKEVYTDSLVINMEGGIKTESANWSPFGTNYSTYHCRIQVSMIITPRLLLFTKTGPPSCPCSVGGFYLESDFNRDPMQWGITPSMLSMPLDGGLDRVIGFLPGRLTRINNMTNKAITWPIEAWEFGCENFVTPDTSSFASPGIAFPSYSWSPEEHQTFAMAENLGLIHAIYSIIDNGAWLNLTAYRIGSETQGEFVDTTAWPLGLSAEGLPEALSAFPNPTGGTLFIQGWNQTAQATVTDATGRIVLQQRFQEGQPLDLHAFPNGLYWIVLQNEKRRGLAKISVLR